MKELQNVHACPRAHAHTHARTLTHNLLSMYVFSNACNFVYLFVWLFSRFDTVCLSYLLFLGVWLRQHRRTKKDIKLQRNSFCLILPPSASTAPPPWNSSCSLSSYFYFLSFYFFLIIIIIIIIIFVMFTFYLFIYFIFFIFFFFFFFFFFLSLKIYL